MTSATEIWQSLGSSQGNVIAAAVTVLVPVVAYYLRPSVRLRWGRANQSFHPMKKAAQPLEVNVEKHYLQNTGRKPATNIEFVYNYEPGEVSVWQPREYTTATTSDKRFVLKIPFLAPKELLVIDSIYVNVPPAIIVSVKCAENLGKEVEFRVYRYFGKYVRVLDICLGLIGLYYVINLIVPYFMK